MAHNFLVPQIHTGAKKLVQIANEEGLRTAGGNKLVKSRLADLLSDPFYYGKICWNGEIYDGKQEPLIAKELFDRVQEVLKSKSTPKGTFVNNLTIYRRALCGFIV